MWKLHEIQISLFINKTVLEHSHAHSFMCYLWRVLCYSGRTGSSIENVWPAKSKIINYLAFYSYNMRTPLQTIVPASSPLSAFSGPIPSAVFSHYTHNDWLNT